MDALPLSQMNVRLDAETKCAGDKALDSIGIAPSRFLRILWGYLARHRFETQTIQQLLNLLSDNATEADDAQSARLAAFHQSIGLRDSIMQENGYSATSSEAGPPNDSSNSSFDDMLYEAMTERYEKRGAWL